MSGNREKKSLREMSDDGLLKAIEAIRAQQIANADTVLAIIRDHPDQVDRLAAELGQPGVRTAEDLERVYRNILKCWEPAESREDEA
jgi:hypothetical protein